VVIPTGSREARALGTSLALLLLLAIIIVVAAVVQLLRGSNL
jgi:hypothetical protein